MPLDGTRRTIARCRAATVAAACLVAACQSSGGRSATIHVSRSVEAAFNSYKDGWGPDEFWISLDGNHADWRNCALGVGQCGFPGPGPQELCERESGQPCALLAVEGEIVRREPVTFASGSNPGPPTAISGSTSALLDVSWSGHSAVLPGSVARPRAAGRGRLWFRIPGSDLPCWGDIDFRTRFGLAGEWKVKCPNEVSASGSLGDAAGGSISGSGEDSRGRKISIRAMPR